MSGNFAQKLLLVFCFLFVQYAITLAQDQCSAPRNGSSWDFPSKTGGCENHFNFSFFPNVIDFEPIDQKQYALDALESLNVIRTYHGSQNLSYGDEVVQCVAANVSAELLRKMNGSNNHPDDTMKLSMGIIDEDDRFGFLVAVLDATHFHNLREEEERTDTSHKIGGIAARFWYRNEINEQSYVGFDIHNPHLSILLWKSTSCFAANFTFSSVGDLLITYVFEPRGNWQIGYDDREKTFKDNLQFPDQAKADAAFSDRNIFKYPFNRDIAFYYEDPTVEENYPW